MTQILVLLSVALFVASRIAVQADFTTEYQTYVHTYINSGSLGNWTYEEKPCFPVRINDSQIGLDQNWSVVCPLISNHSYHIYCYGSYVDTGPNPETDYDIYVYNPLGELEGYHTPSAGFLQHLGTNGSAFFVPNFTGNYTFVIVNNVKGSKAAQEATFMAIENVRTDVWNEQYIEGMGTDNLPILNTSWACDFVTNSSLVEVYMNVPPTLDMYEARLYLMSDSTSKNRTVLDGVPLPWEPGLYGVTSNKTSASSVTIGGYNLDSKEYRGNAYASCENYGQGMFINFTSPNPGTNLYHLAFIGEVGNGTVDFLVKTEFNNTSLKPVTIPEMAYASTDTAIAYKSTLAFLQSATMQYTNDSWNTVNTLGMDISNQTCNATIPGQPAGTTVNYVINAEDTLENSLNASGSYQVKYLSTLNLTSIPLEADLGTNVSLIGLLTPAMEGVPVGIFIYSNNETKQLQCSTLQNGTFVASFKPDKVGTWFAYAEFNGSSYMYQSDSSSLKIQVNEPLSGRYSFYIIGGVGAMTAVGMLVYMRKSKG